ncbi:hypothetical protein BX616_011382, partial [Lobosporangium transversale]
MKDDFLFDNLDFRVPPARDIGPERERIIVDPSKYVEHLTQAWINERAAPDVLQYEQATVDGLLAKIEEQV